MSDEIKKEGIIDPLFGSFDEMLPRSIIAEVDKERLSKQGQNLGGLTGNVSVDSFTAGAMGGGQSIYRNPARRFYDPEITVTAIYLPKDIKRRNRWNRWYYDHDEIVGAVLDVHAELPYSKFQIKVDDPVIQREIEDCLDRTNFFSMLPLIDLEYMKIGEVFIHTHWSDTLGMWDNIVIHNPDYIEVKYSPFADQESVIELSPDEELKSLIHSTRPEDQQLKKRLPQDIVKRVLTGRNIVLNSEDVTHIARRSNPYDIRGKSIVERLYRCFTPKTLVRMSDGSCKEIKDVVIGEEVFSKNGEKRKVLDVVNYDIDDTIVEIKTEKSSESLKCTIGHGFLVRKQYCSCGCGTELTYKQIKNHSYFIHGHNIRKDNNFDRDRTNSTTAERIYKTEKVESQNIKEGDCLLVPISNEIGECNITEGQARLLGYFMAEGSFCNENSKQPGIEFVFGKHETNTWVEDVVNILENDFNISPNIYQGYNGKNICWIKVVRRADYLKLAEFLNDNMKGRRSWNKEFAEKVLYYPKEIQKQILFGAFRGDGQYTKNWEAIYTSTSKKLAEQIQWILFRCKFYNYIKQHDPEPAMICSNTHISIRKRYYNVRITGNYSKDFIKECWDDYKILELEDTELYDVAKELKDKGYSLYRIAKEMNTAGYKGIEGGKLYNNIISGILKNKGSIGKNYQFSRDRITNDNDYFYVPVKSVNKIKYKGKVYDITVDVNHWWLAGGDRIASNTLMYEDKLKEAQQTICDNFIYPLKLFKLGDPQRGWIPSKSHQQALAQMLQQASFDPNFSLIYHYGLSVDYITVADKVMNLDKEWNEINEKKFMALGVSKQFLQSGENYAAANVGLQTQLARYRAKRDLFEVRWIRNKFFKVMAERNGWYKRDAREITSNVRIQRNKEELSKRLIIPEIIWDKKLAMRDDQQYLTFLNNVYAQGKGPVSALTLLMSMGLSLNDELSNKQKQKEFEQKFGITLTPPSPAASGGPAGAPPLAPPTASSKIKEFFKFGKNKEVVQESKKEETKISYDESKITETTNDLTGAESKVKYGTYSEEDEIKLALDISKDLYHIDEGMWKIALKSPNISYEVATLLNSYDDKVKALEKKANGDFIKDFNHLSEEIKPILSDVYMQGKFASYDVTNFLPIYKEQYNRSKDIKDFSDLTLINEFGSWVEKLSSANIESKNIINNLRSIANTCFSFGQLKGYQEQGIERVKVSNTLYNDGLRYAINDLLSKGRNLTAILSSEGDIITYIPCIENEDEDIVIDSHISRYKDFISGGIRISNCPVEFAQQVTKFTNKLGKFIKKKYDNIFFVKDIVDLPEWEEIYKQKAKKEFEDSSEIKESKDKDMIEPLISSMLMTEKLKKRGNMPIFINNRNLYVSNWLGTKDKSLVDDLINYIKLDNESVDKIIRKAYDENSYNLSKNEIETYKVFGYIEPISDEKEIVGWRIVESNLDKTASSYNKLRYGKIWSSEGICLDNLKDPVQLFNDNLKMWIEYPHKLDENLKHFFEKI